MANGAVTARLNQEGFDRAVEKLGRHNAAIAAQRALNRAIVSARAPIIKAVSADMGIRQADVRAAITIVKASRERLVARMTARGARLPLIKFKARGSMPSRGKGRGVTASVDGRRKRYKHAFIARMPTGHVGVFKRDESRKSGKKSAGAWGPNLPITELHGASIVHVFDKHRNIGVEAGRESLMKNLAHELKWAIEESSVS